jgi:hypothetical protein
MAKDGQSSMHDDTQALSRGVPLSGLCFEILEGQLK